MGLVDFIAFHRTEKMAMSYQMNTVTSDSRIQQEGPAEGCY